MRSTRTRILSGALLAVIVIGAIVWAVTRGGSPATGVASTHPCLGSRASVSSAPVPAALAGALPILARPHTSQDAPPHESISMLDSMATGIELDHAQLLRDSPQGGRAWIVPVLHESPQLTPSIACRQSQISWLEQAAHRGSDSRQSVAAFVGQQRRQIAAAEQYQRTHSAGPPGVIVFTQGQIVQGANGTLGAISDGSAFATGECAGPGHNLLTVSGLAPAGTATIQLRFPDGATQTQPVGDGAYSFLFAPGPTSASLPDRLLLLDASGRTLRTLAITGGSFSSHPQCTIRAPQRQKSRGVIPAGFTVIGADLHGPGGDDYTIGVASGGAPACAPEITIQGTTFSSGGGTRFCELSPTVYSPIPTFNAGGGGKGRVELDGSVSSAVKRLRFVAPDGQSVTTPVFAAPPAIARGYGVVVAIGPADILGANPRIESLGAGGRVLASTRLRGFSNLGKHYPVKQLPPGIVTLTHAKTPQGPVAIELHRIRFMEHVSLCITQQPQGNEQCARYPIGPQSGQEIGKAPIWLMPGGRGSCESPRYQVITGILLRGGLTAWLRTPTSLSRMSTVAVPKAFGEPGPLVYAVLRKAPDTILLRDAQGRTVYSRPAVAPTFSGRCGGLNPDTTG